MTERKKNPHGPQEVRQDSERPSWHEAERRDGFLLDTVGAMEKEGKAGSYISGVLKPIKNFLAWNEITIQKKIKVKGSEAAATLSDERTPTPEEGLEWKRIRIPWRILAQTVPSSPYNKGPMKLIETQGMNS